LGKNSKERGAERRGERPFNWFDWFDWPGKIRFAATFGAYIAYTYQGETGWRIPIADFLTIIVSDVEKIYIICNTGSGFSIDR
jgi:hypothetical protein